MFYYWFVAMLEDALTVKTRIAKYILFILDKMISAYGVYLRFKYFKFLIYFN